MRDIRGNGKDNDKDRMIIINKETKNKNRRVHTERTIYRLQENLTNIVRHIKLQL
jgi:hypothetical protein